MTAKMTAAKPSLRDQLRGRKLPTTTVPMTIAEGVTVAVELRALGAFAYDDILTEHPPSEAQRDRGLTFNPRTFLPALLGKCATDPDLDATFWVEFATSASTVAEVNKLFTAAVELNAATP